MHPIFKETVLVERKTASVHLLAPGYFVEFCNEIAPSKCNLGSKTELRHNLGLPRLIVSPEAKTSRFTARGAVVTRYLTAMPQGPHNTRWH